MPELQHHLRELREHLETFYATLRLAPPYHSIEKALAAFGSEFKSKPQQEQQQALFDVSLKQRMYLCAIMESGLYKKHRGIITALLKAPTSPTFAKEHEYLLDPFLEDH